MLAQAGGTGEQPLAPNAQKTEGEATGAGAEPAPSAETNSPQTTETGTTGTTIPQSDAPQLRPGGETSGAVPEPQPPADMAAPQSGGTETVDIQIGTDTPPQNGFASLFDGISSFVELGGPVVALLLVLSVFALAIILVKLWQFYVVGGASNKKISKAVSVWLAQNYEEALGETGTLRGPVAKVVHYAMAGAAECRDDNHLREETEHLAAAELSSLRSYLRGLEAVVQVAPLMGLFGTVLGMIEAFRSLEAAGAQVNPADLAGGIWVALLTTAVGLAIAMPVSLVLYWYESHIAKVKAAMELFATEVMTNPPARTVKPVEGARVRLAAAAEGKNAN